MKKKVISLIIGMLLVASVKAAKVSLNAQGVWITEKSGHPMANPQPSGLVMWRQNLLFISDRSADEQQRQRIHQLDPDSGKLLGHIPISVDANLTEHCFYSYVAENPDYEAMVLDVDDDSTMYLVTEDADDARLTQACSQKYRQTGSAERPFLLLKVLLSEQSAQIVAIKPIQFEPRMEIGAFANDGIEGLAMTPERVLYLALEKDQQSNPRIFTIDLDKVDWQSREFTSLKEPKLKFPQPGDGQHPLNAMQYIPAKQAGHPGYLAAFARNINQLWLIDLAGQKQAQIISIGFYAPTATEQCPRYEKMHNASIEGVALDGKTLWMVNDPWKRMYSRNIQCESNRAAYEAYAPLLFKVPLFDDWLP